MMIKVHLRRLYIGLGVDHVTRIGSAGERERGPRLWHHPLAPSQACERTQGRLSHERWSGRGCALESGRRSAGGTPVGGAVRVWEDVGQRGRWQHGRMN